MPFAYLGAPPAIVHLHAYPREPYALYEIQHGQTINLGTHMVNPSLMCLTQMFPQGVTPVIHP